ncbi:MAG: DUF4129 domain-containing protein [Ornithinimicrobium sp.]
MDVTSARAIAVRIGAACGVLFVAGVLLWGAGSGEPLLGEPSVRLPEGSVLPDDAQATAETLPMQQSGDVSNDDDGSGLNLPLIFQVATAALIAWLVVRWLRHREARGSTDFIAVEPADELTLLVQATATGEDIAAPRDGEPRNAVVACWVALEDALARAGAAPRAGETSLDLTQRILNRWQVDPAPLHQLADLFREARFSRHPITQAHADAAREALGHIHQGLARAAAQRDREANVGSGAHTPVKEPGMP